MAGGVGGLGFHGLTVHCTAGVSALAVAGARIPLRSGEGNP